MEQKHKIFLIILLFFSILGVIILTNIFLHQQNEAGLFPFGMLGIDIVDEAVYTNGTVRFTAQCHFKSFGGYPKPSGDLYQIIAMYVWTERNRGELMDFTIDNNGEIKFNQTLGDIQNVSKASVTNGDLILAMDEEVSLKFQTAFPLHNHLSIYTGVLAFGPTGLFRWEVNATILTPISYMNSDHLP